MRKNLRNKSILCNRSPISATYTNSLLHSRILKKTFGLLPSCQKLSETDNSSFASKLARMLITILSPISQKSVAYQVGCTSL